MTSTSHETPTADVVLHAERLQITTADRPAQRVVVRRRITTETRQVEVVLRREVLEIEHLPVDGEGLGGPDAGLPLVVVLSEEVPVLTVRTRPYERVTVHVTRVDGDVRVTEPVSHETVEVYETNT